MMTAFTEQLEARIVEMVKKGVNHINIRHELQIGSRRLQEVIKKHGLNSGRGTKTWSDEELAIIEQMYFKDGKSPTEIHRAGALPGRSRASISTRCYSMTNSRCGGETANVIPKDQLAARLAEIPADRRSKTARVFGDPVFERSALFEKLKEQHTIPIRRVA
ncbi:hypothetical protein C3731_17515 [Brucella oryzae]|uniref:Uncharacterized protein n=2 Tax=Brucella oryzae TaxID=335286 RepID=A0A2S7IW65_9HYPH|nr:hypothetical protein C3731_17515 [Brucella oryzae]